MPKVTRQNLTPTKLKSAKPRASHYRLWDSGVPGLAVRVMKSGTKSFEVHWPSGAKVIGKFPVMTLEAARQQGRKMLAEADEHGMPEAARKVTITTLREFIEHKYRPWVAANLKWQGAPDRILSTFGEFVDKPLAKLTAWQLDKWRNERIKAGRAVATCNRDLDTLRAALYKAMAWGLLEENAAAKVKRKSVDNQRVRFLSDDEDARLRAALARRDAESRASRARANQWRAERDRPLLPFLAEGDYMDHLSPAVLLSLNTGLRRGELTSLLWSDINMEGRRLTVRAAAAKGGRTRHLPLNDEAVNVLAQWGRQVGTEGCVFAFKDAKTAWRKLLADAGITNLRWHDLRHDFASKLVMAGVDLNAVRELLGHADLKMTLRYAHLAPEHLADAVGKLGA